MKMKKWAGSLAFSQVLFVMAEQRQYRSK